MEVLELKEREARKGINQLRRDGEIPGIIYGGEKNINVAANYKEFAKVFKKAGGHELINLKLGKKKILSLLKDLQVHPLKDTFVHFDLLEVTPEKEIRTRVPIKLNGTAKGILAGGVLEELQHHVTVLTKVKDLPSVIEIDITELDMGGSIHVSDVETPKGVTLVDAPSTVIIHLAGIKEEVETEGVLEGEEAETEEASE